MWLRISPGLREGGGLLRAGWPPQDLVLQHFDLSSPVAFRALRCALVRSLRWQRLFFGFGGLLRCCVGFGSLICTRQGSSENGKLLVVLDSLLMSCDGLFVDRLEASPHEHARNIVFCKVRILWYRGEGRQCDQVIKDHGGKVMKVLFR